MRSRPRGGGTIRAPLATRSAMRNCAFSTMRCCASGDATRSRTTAPMTRAARSGPSSRDRSAVFRARRSSSCMSRSLGLAPRLRPSAPGSWRRGRGDTSAGPRCDTQGRARAAAAHAGATRSRQGRTRPGAQGRIPGGGQGRIWRSYRADVVGDAAGGAPRPGARRLPCPSAVAQPVARRWGSGARREAGGVRPGHAGARQSAPRVGPRVAGRRPPNGSQRKGAVTLIADPGDRVSGPCRVRAVGSR